MGEAARRPTANWDENTTLAEIPRPQPKLQLVAPVGVSTSVNRPLPRVHRSSAAVALGLFALLILAIPHRSNMVPTQTRTLFAGVWHAATDNFTAHPDRTPANARTAGLSTTERSLLRATP